MNAQLEISNVKYLPLTNFLLREIKDKFFEIFEMLTYTFTQNNESIIGNIVTANQG